MSRIAWTPWHQVVQLREDLKSKELPLSIFAADLYDVVMGRAKPVYQEPAEFFALTYPTVNLRELARDVVLRLAGRSDKAVRQLVLTYGGGKTHALITLYHLVNRPEELPDLPAVQEFRQRIGMMPPAARVAVLAFDRLDPVTGMDVRAPDGSMARLRYPWSVLAFQLGGEEGLRILGCTAGNEREEPPFTNVLEDLLRLPKREGRATLVLMDEVLMWARTKCGADPVWRDRLQDFFQCLTQAATRVEGSAVVASLLSTDPRHSDAVGKQILAEIRAILQREQEELVEPVVKEDIAEVLRRRFFTPDSIRDRDRFRAHVVAAVNGIADLDETTRRDRQGAETRFLSSYPFHPDLTEIFYGRWTQLEGFQRTRGVLRTFALALREAQAWDEAPLVGVNVFLAEPGKAEISEAARELATIAATEEYEGKRQEWSAILQGEFEKAREIEAEATALRFRELEQAVFATFLCSQPIGQRGLTRELLLLLGATRPDRIELEKALRRWTEESWFLDETNIEDAETRPDGQKELPRSWRLGSKPNLRQMHQKACEGVSPDLVEARLLDEIGRLRSLTLGASGAGVHAHSLPERPRDIEDDGEFHYGILGPRAVSDSGKPSSEARRFIDETTGPDRPRVYRNAVVLAAPSRDGLEVAKQRIRQYLGWEGVRALLKEQQIDPIREATLAANTEGARKKIPGAIQQAYCVVVTVGEDNSAQAFRMAVGEEPLFKQIKADARARVQETAISADALLPEGPYDLWREGEMARRVKDLVGAFAQFPHLPKMLNRQAILDTLVQGCMAGAFVLRLTRPDRSVRTFWRQQPDDVALKDPALEAVLPEAAALTELSARLLEPGALPGLWTDGAVAVDDLYAYFSGGHQVRVEREQYEDVVTTPAAGREVIDAAVEAAVCEGRLWLISGPATLLGEEIPTGLLAGGARLQPPPAPIDVTSLLPSNLPEAWSEGATTARALSEALSRRAGNPLPWATIRNGITAAIQARMLESTARDMYWPCDYSQAGAVALRVPEARPPGPDVGWIKDEKRALVARALLRSNQIQDLGEAIPALTKAAVGHDLAFEVAVSLDGEPPEELAERVNKLLGEIDGEFVLQPAYPRTS
jgi:hypothetical protein